MTHVNFLFHRLLVSETQTDRQDKFVIDIYIYIHTRMPVATLPDSNLSHQISCLCVFSVCLSVSL